MIFELAGFAVATSVTLLALIAHEPTDALWSVVPLTVSGGLALADVFRVIAKRLDVLSMRALLSVFLFVFAYLSPILQILWDYWPTLPSSARSPESVSLWAWSWMFGVILFRLALRGDTRRDHRPRVFNEKLLSRWSMVLLLGSLLAQVAVYARFGGVLGFVETFSARSGGLVDGNDPYEGMGMLVALADGSRFIIAILVARFAAASEVGRTRRFLVISSLILFGVFLLLGGLRGSRGVTVYAMFFYLVLYHFWVRRLSLLVVVLGAAMFLSFMTTYAYYKFYGIDGLGSVIAGNSSDLGSDRGEAIQYVLARDLGRMDVQVLSLQRSLFDGGSLALGRSYIGAPFSVVPDLPFLPQVPTVTKEKVELLFGRGSYSASGARQTSLLLGQYGELVLNFGLAGIPLFFGLWAWLARASDLWLRGLRQGDPRVLFAPAVLLLPVQFVMYDSSLLVMFYFKLLLFPVLIYLLAVRNAVSGSSRSMVRRS